MAKVNLENITKVFGKDVVAVNDISLDILDKEFIVLVGPSGCGKTTTLRMIAGLEEITKGDIKIDSKVVNEIPPKDRDIAMVFQNYALYPHMTVYKNMAFGLKLRKFPKEEIKQRVVEAARILGIGNLLDRKPKELSGGQRQRVAVGRAIVRKPKAFLFDEPLSNLDAKLRVEMRAELNKLHQKLQTTTIYVTHDQIEAMTLGSRIVVMNQGEIQQVDEPLNVYDYPNNKFVAGFIGTPPMNFVKGTLYSENGRMIFKEDSNNITLLESYSKYLSGKSGQEVFLGIRPENLLVHEHPEFNKNRDGLINTKVNVVEPLGDEQIVYLSTPQNTLIGKVDSHYRIKVNEEIQVACDLSKIHIFDGQTEQNLVLPVLKGQ